MTSWNVWSHGWRSAAVYVCSSSAFSPSTASSKLRYRCKKSNIIMVNPSAFDKVSQSVHTRVVITTDAPGLV